jgi:Na+/glutamate symporter
VPVRAPAYTTSIALPPVKCMVERDMLERGAIAAIAFSSQAEVAALSLLLWLVVAMDSMKQLVNAAVGVSVRVNCAALQMLLPAFWAVAPPQRSQPACSGLWIQR